MKVYTDEELKKLYKSLAKALQKRGILLCDNEFMSELHHPAPVEVILHAYPKDVIKVNVTQDPAKVKIVLADEKTASKTESRT